MSASSGNPNAAPEMAALVAALAACDVPPMVSIRIEVSPFSEVLCGGFGTLRPDGGDRLEVGSYERLIIQPPAGCVVTAAEIEGAVVEGSINVPKVDTEIKVPEKDVIVHVEYHKLESKTVHHFRA